MNYLFVTDLTLFLCLYSGFHLSALTGTTSHPDMQKIRTIVFFIENRLRRQYEVEKIILLTAF